MLVLSRQVGESILIGEDIEVVVKSIAGGKVSLGFKAPRHVRIRRTEIPEHAPEARPPSPPSSSQSST